ncbi:MAG: hypothetical protein GX957_14430 [Clostridiaceae bacterium]|nr:hypothetical protein [Clostridiaceae bacterium]
MGKAIGFATVSILVGIGTSFLSPDIGIILSISIIGGGIISSIEKRK